jgi:hypothetical protein
MIYYFSIKCSYSVKNRIKSTNNFRYKQFFFVATSRKLDADVQQKLWLKWTIKVIGKVLVEDLLSILFVVKAKTINYTTTVTRMYDNQILIYSLRNFALYCITRHAGLTHWWWFWCFCKWSLLHCNIYK